MRFKLWAAIIGISATLAWAFFHQFSKNEPLPTAMTLYAFEASDINAPLATNVPDYKVILQKNSPETATLEHKIDTMLIAIKDNWGGIFVYSNGDVTVPVPSKDVIAQALSNTDILVERTDDEQLLHSGYIACRANKKTLQLWETIKHMLDEHLDVHPEDQHQDYLAALLHKKKIAKLRWDFAPRIENQQANSMA